MLRLRQAARFPCQLRLQPAVTFITPAACWLCQYPDGWIVPTMRQPVGTGIRLPARRRSRRRNRKTRRYRVSCRNLPVVFRKLLPQIVQKAAHFLANMARVRRACRSARFFRQAGRSSGSGRAAFATHGFIICKHFSKTAQTKGRYNTATARRGQNAPMAKNGFPAMRLNASVGIRFTMGLRRMGISLTAGAPFRTYCGRAGAALATSEALVWRR